MNRAVVTYFDDDYFVAYVTMIKSLLKYNPNFDLDLVVYDWGISDANKEECLFLYENTKFVPVNRDNYFLDEETMSTYYFAKNFQKFDLLNISDYDQILVIDADYVVINDITPIFTNHLCGFYVDLNEVTEYEGDVPYPDTGLMVIDKEFLCGNYYESCLEDMKREFVKDARDNATCASNEHVFERVFKGKLTPLKDEFLPCDIDDILKERYVVMTPQYKYWLGEKKYEGFENRLPWDNMRELKKSIRFVKFLMDRQLL